MSEALLVSNVVLWFCVVALSFVVFGLVRQLGVLHERIAPVGAMAAASPLEVGKEAPVVQVENLNGGDAEVGRSRTDGVSTLLFFLSPTCPVCKTLLPTVLRIAAEQSRALKVVFASDGDAEAQSAFVREHGLDGFAYVLSTALGLAYHVSKLPYAVLIDADGIVRAKGLVNNREHIESLFTARDHGVASIQEYVAKKRDASNEHAIASKVPR